MYFRTDTEKERLDSAKKIYIFPSKVSLFTDKPCRGNLNKQDISLYIFLGKLSKALHSIFSRTDAALLFKITYLWIVFGKGLDISRTREISLCTFYMP